MIAALLAADLQSPALVCVRDPDAAEQAIAAGVGAIVALEVGGKLDTIYNEPAPSKVLSRLPVPPGSFQRRGVHRRRDGHGGLCRRPGGRVSLLIRQRSVMTVDPAMYRAVGLEPNDAGIVVVKSHIQFRAGTPASPVRSSCLTARA